MSTAVISGCPGKDSQQEPPPYVMSNMDNFMYGPHSDKQQQHPVTVSANPQKAVSGKRPFDWFILSVLGCLCFPLTGICAMYYAFRANHGVDWNLNQTLVKGHTKKAKILTIFSIAFGLLIILAIIITIVLLVQAASHYYYNYNYNNGYYNNGNNAYNN